MLKSYIYPPSEGLIIFERDLINMRKLTMDGIAKYEFTFTASSLKLNEMILVANASLDKREIDYVNELGNGKSTTGKRIHYELQKRVSTLSIAELNVLAKGDLVSQKQMAFLSICKAYAFISDFVIETLREKLLVFDYEITEGDYISFYRRKAEGHPELDELTEITRYKIRQVTFKILEQAGMIDKVKTKVIQPQILDRRVVEAIISDDPKWFKIFFMSDLDIANLNN